METTAATMSTAPGTAGIVVFWIAAAVIATWCVPLIIAALFGLPHKGAIAVLCLALGWTGIAWLAALVIVTVGAILASRGTVGPALPYAPAYAGPPGAPPWTPAPPEAPRMQPGHRHAAG